MYRENLVVSGCLTVLTKHLGREVLVFIFGIKLLLRVIEDIRVFRGVILWETATDLSVQFGNVRLSVRLEELFVFDIKIQSWSVPKLVPGRNLKRHENFIDRLLLGST